MARAFNGSTQYLERTEAIVTGFPVTLSCWIHLDSATGRFNGPAIYNTSGANLIAIEYLGSGIVANYGWRAIAVQNGYTSASEYRSGSNSTTGWHGFAASWGAFAQVPNMWVDGAKVTGGTTFTGSGGTLSVNRTGIATYVFNAVRGLGAGRVAFAAIWNAELTDAELKAVTQITARHPAMIRFASLQGCWDLGGHSGQNDLSRVKGVDMTAIGSPTWGTDPGIIYPRVQNVGKVSVAAGGATPWLYARRSSRIIGGGVS